MKKILSVVLMIAAFTLSLRAQDRIVTYNELPENAKLIITQHFTTEGISLIKYDWEVFDSEYEVHYTNGTELSFTGKGELKKVDCGMKQVPDALIPEQVLSYVRSSYPNAFITEWEKDDREWKAELNNGIELVFNKNYQLIDIDD